MSFRFLEAWNCVEGLLQPQRPLLCNHSSNHQTDHTNRYIQLHRETVAEIALFLSSLVALSLVPAATRWRRVLDRRSRDTLSKRTRDQPLTTAEMVGCAGRVAAVGLLS